MQPRHILLTSLPAQGKTTVCRKLIDTLIRSSSVASSSSSKATSAAAASSSTTKINLLPGSFVTEETRSGGGGGGGARTGFQFVFFNDPRAKDPVPLAVLNDGSNRGPQVGKYSVCVQNVEMFAVPALREMKKRASASAAKTINVCVIDEIGKMETNFSKDFCACVKDLLHTPASASLIVIATVPAHGTKFIEELKAAESVELLQLTQQNRDAIPQLILDKILQQT